MHDPLIAKRAAPTCLCNKGYTGAGCQARHATCPNDCSGNGQCVQETVGGVTAAQCRCAAGFGGPGCDDACPAKCSGRGRCVRSARAQLVCLCNAGYGGAGCADAATCPNACSGRGACANGVCACEAGFAGVDCGRDARSRRIVSAR